MYKNSRGAFLYLLPAIVLVSIFIYIAVGLNFYYSLFRWNTYSAKVWVGLANYTRLVQDSSFWIALKNNILFAVISVTFQVGIALALAAMLEQKWIRRLGGFCRTVFFVPSLLSMTVVALMWQLMLNPNMGFVNKALQQIGLGAIAIDWLGNASTAIFCVIASSQWQFVGYTTMLFVVAIQKIPDDFYEAAEIDGANPVQSFFYITVPNVKEMLLLNLTTTLIGAFKVFDEVYVMTNGGPGRASEVLGTLLFRSGFREDAMGYASAVGAVVFVITFVLSIAQIRLFGIDNTSQPSGR